MELNDLENTEKSPKYTITCLNAARNRSSISLWSRRRPPQDSSHQAIKGSVPAATSIR